MLVRPVDGDRTRTGTGNEGESMSMGMGNQGESTGTHTGVEGESTGTHTGVTGTNWTVLVCTPPPQTVSEVWVEMLCYVVRSLWMDSTWSTAPTRWGATHSCPSNSKY